MLDGNPFPPPKRAQLPQIFGPCLSRPNGWMIKMPLGMEVGLDPDDIVVWGPSRPPPKKKRKEGGMAP